MSKKNIICSYSGKRGAYAQQAIDKYFQQKECSVESLALDSFPEVFNSVIDGRADYGMIPIENSLNGSIYQNYDNFSRFEDVEIAGSVTLSIHHSLLVCKGTKIDDIKNVYSHPQGFGQSLNFLSNYKKWNLIDSVSTATAAEFVARENSKNNAAIGSVLNAEIYGLEILAEDIQDDLTNFTRFVLIAKKSSDFTSTENSNMASLVFTTKNEPGALYRTLGTFEKHHLNMTRIASRPIKGELWKSWFYVDLEIKEKIDLKKVFDDLGKITEDYRVLGIYSEGCDEE